MPPDRRVAAPDRPVLLVSTYDQGRQPTALARCAALLRQAGRSVTVADLAVHELDPAALDAAGAVVLYLPMHTASRLALPLLDRLHRHLPHLPVAAFGLYATLNAPMLHDAGVDVVLRDPPGDDLLAFLGATGDLRSRPPLAVPDRRGLPGLDRYARLVLPGGAERVVGATETTIGCRHRCRHCPVAAVHRGRFRAVRLSDVLADVDALVAAGAEHVTFADPDFLNGPVHARRVVDAVHRRHPGLSYDVTVKVSHLVAHPDAPRWLADAGCVLVTSAFESVDPVVLDRLDKGHTVDDLDVALERCAGAALPLQPTFVPFTPWTTAASFVALLDWVAARELVDVVAPVQYGIRLLVTAGSALLDLPEVAAVTGPFDAERFAHPWHHPDPAVDTLAAAVMSTVSVASADGTDRRELHAALRRLATGEPGTPDRATIAGPAHRLPTVPYLTEPWFC